MKKDRLADRVINGKVLAEERGVYVIDVKNIDKLVVGKDRFTEYDQRFIETNFKENLKNGDEK